MIQLRYQNTRLIELKSQIIEHLSIKLMIKREDQNHPEVSGNKWWKLKYNLQVALQQGHDCLLTYGGAWSNHIYAVAAAARELKIKSIGVVRGDETREVSSTLRFAQSCGMKLHPVSREDYRKKTEPEFIDQLHQQFGNFYLLPEGGTNSLAVQGVSEFAGSLMEEVKFDYICLPVGTGGTMAGLMEGLPDSKRVIGIPVLKGAEFLEKEIERYTTKKNGQLIFDYHVGGYAKTDPSLVEFILNFEKEFGIPLEPVYTGKMMFAVMDLIGKNFFKSGSTVLVLHTGGLQGRSGFNF
jgi:1-aminocyclopropane-1-carboxylate deaminase